jgi:hypothetical protein
MSTTSDLLTWGTYQLRVQGLTPYLGRAPQGVGTYPLVVISIPSSKSDYEINNYAARYDTMRLNVSVFDNTDNPARLLDALNKISLGLDAAQRTFIGSSYVIGSEQVNTIGPIWLNKEHYWATYVNYEIIMGTQTTGITPSGKIIVSGTVDIPVGASSVTLPALGLTPIGLVLNVTKPTEGDFSLFPTIREDTLAPTGTIIDLSGTVDKVGYKLIYMASN